MSGPYTENRSFFENNNPIVYGLITAEDDFLAYCSWSNGYDPGAQFRGGISAHGHTAHIANGGNGANAGAYVDWAMSVDGVGWARCFPAQNPAGTAKPGECSVYVIGTDGFPASSAVVNAVQMLICPDQDGSGAGLAPMGAKCKVYAPTAKTVNVDVQITGERTGVEEAIRAYIKADAYRDNTLSYAQMLKAIMSVDGVIDCTLTINGDSASITCEDYEVFVPGTVTVR